MSMQRPNPYQVLNVSPDAEPEVIEAAYKVLMKKYHPDRHVGAEAKAAELNQAFNLLRDVFLNFAHSVGDRVSRFLHSTLERLLGYVVFIAQVACASQS